jgi:16S rRNA (uracil1498-N3)-methyltransferase
MSGVDNQYFYVLPADVDSAGGFLLLRDEEAHHCSNVLRKSAGDECYAVDGAGHEYVIEIQSVQSKEVVCAIKDASFRIRELPFTLTVAAALIKPDHFEWMLEKCVELGVTSFVPLKTSRSHAEPGPNRMNRWRKILLSAMKQSRRSVLPGINPCRTFQSIIGDAPKYDQSLIFHESSVDCLSRHRVQYPVQPESEILIMTGPEGGFTETEITIARDHGCAVLSLGVRRLRSETATVAACSVFSILQSL